MARKTGWKNATTAKGGPDHGKGKAFPLVCPPPLWRFVLRGRSFFLARKARQCRSQDASRGQGQTTAITPRRRAIVLLSEFAAQPHQQAAQAREDATGHEGLLQMQRGIRGFFHGAGRFASTAQPRPGANL